MLLVTPQAANKTIEQVGFQELKWQYQVLRARAEQEGRSVSEPVREILRVDALDDDQEIHDCHEWAGDDVLETAIQSEGDKGKRTFCDRTRRRIRKVGRVYS